MYQCQGHCARTVYEQNYWLQISVTNVHLPKCNCLFLCRAASALHHKSNHLPCLTKYLWLCKVLLMSCWWKLLNYQTQRKGGGHVKHAKFTERKNFSQGERVFKVENSEFSLIYKISSYSFLKMNSTDVAYFLYHTLLISFQILLLYVVINFKYVSSLEFINNVNDWAL